MDTLNLYNQTIWPMFEKYCLPDRKKLNYFFLAGSPQEMPKSSLSYMMGQIQKMNRGSWAKFYVQRGALDVLALERDLKRSKKPVLIFATAFSLKSFLDFLAERGQPLNLMKNSRIVETGGFKGHHRELSKKKLYALCQKWLGIGVPYCLSEYGMTELTSQFYDHHLYHHTKGKRRAPVKVGPAWTRVLVVDPLTGRTVKRGQRGLIRIFDLANRGSVMAIQTQDMGRMKDEGFEILGRYQGAELRGCSLTYEELLKK